MRVFAQSHLLAALRVNGTRATSQKAYRFPDRLSVGIVEYLPCGLASPIGRMLVICQYLSGEKFHGCWSIAMLETLRQWAAEAANELHSFLLEIILDSAKPKQNPPFVRRNVRTGKLETI